VAAAWHGKRNGIAGVSERRINGSENRNIRKRNISEENVGMKESEEMAGENGNEISNARAASCAHNAARSVSGSNNEGKSKEENNGVEEIMKSAGNQQ
jgi:hypothetical protein